MGVIPPPPPPLPPKGSEPWQNPVIEQALADSQDFFNRIRKRKNPGFMNRAKRSREKEKELSLIDWDSEFQGAWRKVGRLRRSALKPLLSEALTHMFSAYKARKRSLFCEVDLHIRAVDKIVSFRELTLYFNALSKAGIFVKKMERPLPLKEANIERFLGGEGRNGTSFSDLLDCYFRGLRCLAVCAQIGKRFPGIAFRASIICEDGQFPSDIFPILHIGNQAYLPKDQRLHSRPLQVETDEENSNLIISSNSRFEDVFSEDELRPFALSYDLPREGFVMPNIIDGFAKHQKEFRHSYVSVLFAASLGMTDLVYAYAEFFVKESIQMAFYNQGVKGRLRTGKEKKQKRASSFIPLSTSTRTLNPFTLRDVLISLEPQYTFDILRIESVSIHSVVPDVYEDTLYNKIHCARNVAKSIRSIILKFPGKMPGGFAAFIPIGPWVFETRISSGRRDPDHNFLRAPP